jgi:site-specific DNA recombinase
MSKTEVKNIRAVGYARTSGEDFTSIEHQQNEIRKFVDTNGFGFVHHYRDEALSGAKIAGRDDFQRMLKDAANGIFDVIVIFDISRFARDGSDIIGTATFLKRQFGIHVMDTKGSFDTRKPRNSILNFTLAGVAEDERLRIMERTLNGRIKNASKGLPWNHKSKWPIGREFDKATGKWVINEKGVKLQQLLTRYANGEHLVALVREYGFGSKATVTRNVRESQLSGTYHARFHSPEIEINHLKVPVPNMPEIIPADLDKRVKDRFAFNQTWNKQEKRKYVLSSFVTCSHCGLSLTGKFEAGHVYYVHGKKCIYGGIRGDVLEEQVLDYLYNFFLDEPAYTKAIKAALPSSDDRKALENDIKQATSELNKINSTIANLQQAVIEGKLIEEFFPLDKQNELKARKLVIEKRIATLNQQLATMPDFADIEQNAMLLRLHLMQEHQGKDWHEIPYDEIRQFLHYLFSDNPRKAGHGIFLGYINDRWTLTFKGSVEFNHDVIDGRPISHVFQKAVDTANAHIKRTYNEAMKQANIERQQAETSYFREVTEAQKLLAKEKCGNIKHDNVHN